jgi:hypothetical protein
MEQHGHDLAMRSGPRGPLPHTPAGPIWQALGMEASDQPPQIPADAILSQESVLAGVAALERIHGRHLADMSAQEQAEAREHWRQQVEQVLAEVHRVNGGDAGVPGAGRAVVTFADAGDDRIDVSVAFQPDLQDAGGGQVAGTPAQVLALSALESLGVDEEGEAPEQ